MKMYNKNATRNVGREWTEFLVVPAEIKEQILEASINWKWQGTDNGCRMKRELDTGKQTKMKIWISVKHKEIVKTFQTSPTFT